MSIFHKIPPAIIGGSVAHKPRVRRYAYGATEWAIDQAVIAGKVGWDADLTISADGTAWVNHWDKLLQRDSWFDPEGAIPRNASIRDLHDVDLERIRWRDPAGRLWPMLTARQAMEICADVGIIPCFEAKGDSGRNLFYRPTWWERFKDDADEVGIVPIIMSLPGGGAGARKLIAAAAAGLVTMWIHRPGNTVPTTGVDLVKSWPRRPIHRVSIRPVGDTLFGTPPPLPPEGDTPMKFVSRAEWKARPRGATKATHDIGVTRGVTLHWEGPKMGAFPHGECAGKVRGIERFHRDHKKWADIAYNAIVCPHGFVFEGRGVGVKSAANGTTQANDDWYAVCYLGGVGDGLTEDGKQGLHNAVALFRSAGAGARVNGHRDHKATQCPGDDIYRWLQSHDFTPGAEPKPDREERPVPKVNHVQRYREAILAGIAEAETHAEKVMDGREAFETMRAGIKSDVAARLEAGPKK